MDASKEELINFLENEVFSTAENHPDVDGIIKKKVRCTRMRINNFSSADKIEEYFQHAMATEGGIDTYTRLKRINARTFEDVRAEFERLCGRE